MTCIFVRKECIDSWTCREYCIYKESELTRQYPLTEPEQCKECEFKYLWKCSVCDIVKLYRELNEKYQNLIDQVHQRAKLRELIKQIETKLSLIRIYPYYKFELSNYPKFTIEITCCKYINFPITDLKINISFNNIIEFLCFINELRKILHKFNHVICYVEWDVYILRDYYNEILHKLSKINENFEKYCKCSETYCSEQYID